MADFVWTDEIVVVRAVSAIAIYANPHGEIVIRQQDEIGNDDHLVIFPADRVEAIIKAIRDATGG